MGEHQTSTVAQGETAPQGSVKPKPKSSTSPARENNGHVARTTALSPQAVPPEKMSQLLLAEGPLAIRFITKALCKEVEGFKHLSASKQRRLIMGALESGDRRNSVIFAKIGWGQWSAHKVESSDFEKEREATNVANSKIKDLVSQERRRSSTNNGAGVKKPSAPIKREFEVHDRSVFLDENAVASEDEDDDNGHPARDEFYDENDLNENPTIPYDHFKRRKSSVVYGDSPPEEPEYESISQAIRPIFKNYGRRRSSSKLLSPSLSKRGSYRGSNGSSDILSEPSRRRLSSTTDECSGRSMIDLQVRAQKDPEFLGEHSRGREPRSSFSKESSIRSTLVAHSTYRASPAGRLVASGSDSVPRKDSAYQLSSPSPRESDHPDRSDTDEEDWEHIGAESLRNSRAPSLIRSPNMNPVPNLPADHQPSYLSLSPPAMNDSDRDGKPRQQEPVAETEDAAILLMSLKS
ncbi:LAQU0S13e02476g1_1 [Lachancea quebecensis]|uniref:LAQU0S13e02476g1_1 n=1 Tax=Lachancea quebecensis TaxID=1654605 RepID=A0A0P1L1R2_9SACH|nr:LAQU0S13e02476g1_1 [Lachancea quebecensis]